MTTFKDLFSTQAADYAKFRPTYPPELYKYLSKLPKEHYCAWDCGTGNGQAAVELAQYFMKVEATDPSEKQISQAIKNPKILYRVASAENSGLPDKCIDLITVAQAFHWFNQKEFFKEVKRVIKKQGILAVWCYGLAKVNPQFDEAILKFYEGTLGDYWDPGRKLVDEGYRKEIFPFEELVTPKFQIKKDWTFEEFIGYLGTWSALQTYIQKNSKNPLLEISPELKRLWKENGKCPVTWEISLRVFRI
jgi:ubiquinone/menaquinone biosynthesis C-methylase UbiE